LGRADRKKDWGGGSEREQGQKTNSPALVDQPSERKQSKEAREGKQGGKSRKGCCGKKKDILYVWTREVLRVNTGMVTTGFPESGQGNGGSLRAQDEGSMF